MKKIDLLKDPQLQDNVIIVREERNISCKTTTTTTGMKNSKIQSHHGFGSRDNLNEIQQF